MNQWAGSKCLSCFTQWCNQRRQASFHWPLTRSTAPWPRSRIAFTRRSSVFKQTWVFGYWKSSKVTTSLGKSGRLSFLLISLTHLLSVLTTESRGRYCAQWPVIIDVTPQSISRTRIQTTIWTCHKRGYELVIARRLQEGKGRREVKRLGSQYNKNEKQMSDLLLHISLKKDQLCILIYTSLTRWHLVFVTLRCCIRPAPVVLARRTLGDR